MQLNTKSEVKIAAVFEAKLYVRIIFNYIGNYCIFVRS